jgi:DNA-binding NarL/FixJ family response regulator
MIRALLIDESDVVRSGLRAILQQINQLTVVGEATDADRAVQLTRELSPDLVLIDTSVVQQDPTVIRSILAENSNIRIIALSYILDAQVVAEVLRSGASGFLLKDDNATQYLAAVRATLAGETYLPPRVTTVVVANYVCDPRPSAVSIKQPLTTKQREVLQLLAEGMTNKNVASALGVSSKTVEAHRAQIMEKLNVRSVAELTKYAIRVGLTSVNV